MKPSDFEHTPEPPEQGPTIAQPEASSGDFATPGRIVDISGILGQDTLHEVVAAVNRRNDMASGTRWHSGRADLGPNDADRISPFASNNQKGIGGSKRFSAYANRANASRQPTMERLPAESPRDFIERVLTLNEEDQTALRTNVDAATDTLRQLFFDNAEALKRVDQERELLLWRFNGKIGEPLPSIFSASDYDGSLKIQPASASYDSVMNDIVINDCLNKIKAPFDRKVAGVARNNKEALLAAAEEAILDSPTYMIIDSMRSPQVEMMERPLTSKETDLALSALRAKVEQSGVARERVSTHGMYLDGRGRIASRTVSAKGQPPVDAQKSDRDAFRRFCEWAAPNLIQTYNDNNPNEPPLTNPQNIIFNNYILSYEMPPDKPNRLLSSSLTRLSTAVENLATSGPMEQMLKEISNQAFRCEGPDISYSQAVDKKRDEALRAIAGVISGDGVTSEHGWQTLVWLRQSSGTLPETKRVTYHTPQTEGMSGIDKMNEILNTLHGEIIHDGRTEQEKQYGRLIIPTPLRELPPLSNQPIDLRLALGTADVPADFDSTPYIPGFITIGQAHHGEYTMIYDFVRDPNGDPYEPCLVEPTPDEKTALADSYDSRGATIIAEALRNEAGLTIDLFAQTAAILSIYHTPESNIREKYIIENGIVFTQCVGANELDVSALKEAYGTASARVIRGRIMQPGTTKIASAGDAQTLFLHNKRSYIFSAQPPPRNNQSQPNQNTEEESAQPDNDQQPQAQAPQIPEQTDTAPTQESEQAIVPDEQSSEQQPDPVAVAQRRQQHAIQAFSALHQTFETGLKLRLKLPAEADSDMLYGTMRNLLYSGDPWVRTTGAFLDALDIMQADIGAGQEQLEVLKESLVDMAEIAKQASIIKDKTSLRMLESVIKQAQSHITTIIQMQVIVAGTATNPEK